VGIVANKPAKPRASSFGQPESFAQVSCRIFLSVRTASRTHEPQTTSFHLPALICPCNSNLLSCILSHFTFYYTPGVASRCICSTESSHGSFVRPHRHSITIVAELSRAFSCSGERRVGQWRRGTVVSADNDWASDR